MAESLVEAPIVAQVGSKLRSVRAAGALADADAASRDRLLDPPSTTLARKRRHFGYALIMPYDPAKVTRAPPRYQPAAEAHDEEGGPVYDENKPPSWKDFMKAANRARKMLKDLKR